MLNTLNPRMVESKAKPIGVAINWGEIIDVEVNGNGAKLVLAQHCGEESEDWESQSFDIYKNKKSGPF